MTATGGLRGVLPERLPPPSRPDPTTARVSARRRWLAFLLAPLLLWSGVAAYGCYRLATWGCGTSVAAVVDALDHHTDLWSFDASGHPCQRLTSNGGSWSPVRSPDGRWIAYESHAGFAGPAMVDTDSGIYTLLTSVHVMRSDGSGDTRVTTAASRPVRWSADGRRLTYCRWVPQPATDAEVGSIRAARLVTVGFPSLVTVAERKVDRCPDAGGRIRLWQDVRQFRLYWPSE